jgi:hypothetical protein
VDKVGEEYRKLHAERQTVGTQWVDAESALVKRDDAIVQAAERIQELKARSFACCAPSVLCSRLLCDAVQARTREAEIQVKQQASFLAAELAENKVGWLRLLSIPRRLH